MDGRWRVYLKSSTMLKKIKAICTHFAAEDETK